MKERHIALVVEDDRETAEDLSEILRSIDCESVVVDNAEDALSVLQKNSFCLILLDLQIKSAADSIKGHVEHGKALLRKIREKHVDHNGITFWLPVLIVSGFAREVNEAVDIMKDGASDVIQKPFDSRQVSEAIRRALQVSGRETHDRCHEPSPTQLPDLKDGVVIAIPGDRIRHRTRVRIASKTVDITDASLRILLRLMVGQQDGVPVHKVDLGARADQGFKGISNLRNELRQVLGSVEIIDNDYHGNYRFKKDVEIGACAVDKLLKIGDRTISDLAAQLRQPASNRLRKSEGNSANFPPHRRRRHD
jgi:FixJ family two-component response regulator